MKNTIYRLEDGTGCTLEISVFDSNEVEPYREIKAAGVNITKGDVESSIDLEEEDLDSLIGYLTDIRSYISKFNKQSQPK
jgi:hypothetical protein